MKWFILNALIFMLKKRVNCKKNLKFIISRSTGGAYLSIQRAFDIILSASFLRSLHHINCVSKATVTKRTCQLKLQQNKHILWLRGVNALTQNYLKRAKV